MKITIEDLKLWLGEKNLTVPNLLECLLEALDSENGAASLRDDLNNHINERVNNGTF